MDPVAGDVSDPSQVDVRAVRDRILADHRRTVEGVLSAADAVADGWDGEAAADRSAVVDPLRSELARRGLDDRLVVLLVDAVGAAGRELRADPVPAPPYLAVTSRGPVCRATLADGRLVVAVRAFRVERSGNEGSRSPRRGARYVRDGDDPAGSLSVRFEPEREG